MGYGSVGFDSHSVGSRGLDTWTMLSLSDYDVGESLYANFDYYLISEILSSAWILN